MVPDRRREKLEQRAKRSETCRRENPTGRHVSDAVDEIVDKTGCECGPIRAEHGQRSSKIEFSAAFAHKGSADVAKSDSRHRNASDEIEAVNEPIGGLAEPPIISGAKLLPADARHAEHIDRFRRGPRRVGTLCRRTRSRCRPLTEIRPTCSRRGPRWIVSHYSMSAAGAANELVATFS